MEYLYEIVEEFKEKFKNDQPRIRAFISLTAWMFDEDGVREIEPWANYEEAKG